MKHIVCGDLHVQDSNIRETDDIFSFMNEFATSEGIESFIFLGDLFHTHNIVKQTVSICAKRNMKKLSDKKVYYVSGNHDNENPRGGPNNAADLTLIEVGVKVSGFTDYIRIKDTDLYLVGFRHPDMFIETCREIYKQNPNSVIFHHQTIDGSKYESGMPAIGGIQPSELPNKLFIGGHVHTKQSFGKFIYVGSPRALTFSDVNADKGIHILDDETMTMEFISLNALTKCFHSSEYTEADLPDFIMPINVSWKSGDDIKIHIHGSSDFYKAVAEKNKKLQSMDLGKISFIPHIKKTLDSKIDSKQVETDIFKAFEGYIFNVYNADSDMRGKIWDQMQTLSTQV